jgi:hypothetical protein
MRFTLEAVKAVDSWARANSLSRAEAIRRLVEIGLKARKGKT